MANVNTYFRIICLFLLIFLCMEGRLTGFVFLSFRNRLLTPFLLRDIFIIYYIKSIYQDRIMTFLKSTPKFISFLLLLFLVCSFSAYAHPCARAENSSSGLEERYEEALDALYTRKFSEAYNTFTELGDYKDSRRMAEFTLNYQKTEPVFDSRIVDPYYHDETYEHGTLYAYPRGGLYYVPDEVNPDTSFILYHSGGGGGEDYLYYNGVYNYFKNYYPNAVIFFCNESAYDYMYRKNAEMYEVLQHIAYDCGTIVHDISVLGSSLGCYTAMKAAPLFYTEYGQIVNNVCTLDTGLEFVDNVHSLTAEECDIVAEAGTVMYLFEQPEVGLEVEAIARMVDHGVETWLVGCRNDNHSMISKLAYANGVFSWSAGEDIHLPEDEYTFTLLTR